MTLTFWIMLAIAISATAAILVLLFRKRLWSNVPTSAARDPNAERRAAAHVAGKLIAAWHVPGGDGIQAASIRPREGIAFTMNKQGETLSVDQKRGLLVMVMAGTAAEAYAFEGQVRTIAVMKAWADGLPIANDLLENGGADLPWLALADEDTGFRPPMDPNNPRTKLLHATFLHAALLLDRNKDAFVRLMDLLIEKGRITGPEANLVLATMTVRPT
jgi:hypothetical protein